MNVQELIDLLEDIADKNAEVRIAYQRNYPLQVGVRTVTDLTKGSDPNSAANSFCDECDGYKSEEAAKSDGITIEELDEEDMCECNDSDANVSDEDKVVWIATGSATSSGYAPKEAWNGNGEEY